MKKDYGEMALEQKFEDYEYNELQENGISTQRKSEQKFEQQMETLDPKVITLFHPKQKLDLEAQEAELASVLNEALIKEAHTKLVPLAQPLKKLNNLIDDVYWIATFAILFVLTGLLVVSVFTIF